MLAMPGLRAFALAAKRGSEGVSCDADGVFVGGVPLLQPPETRNPFWRVRSLVQVNKELSVRYQFPIDITPKASSLALIAAALNRRDVAMAAIVAVQMQIPDPTPLAQRAESPDEIARRARALNCSGLLKFFWNPAQHPRAGVPPNPGWFEPVADKPGPVEVIPGLAIGNPADKPWEPPPEDEGEERENQPRGILELPLPGGSPRDAEPTPESAAPVGTQTGPKPLSTYGSPSTSPSGQPLPPKIGSFPVPEGLTFGTTLFGNYAHQEIADLLDEMYPDVFFIFRVRPGQGGIDVEVPENAISVVGHAYLEIKPLTPSGERSFYEQLERWGVGPVQALTYDSSGNLYYGFRK